MADDPAAREAAIQDAATTPASVASDGVAVTQRSVRDLIDADRYLGAKRAAANPARSFVRVKIVPPGAV